MKLLEHYFTNNANLKSELRSIKYSYQNYSFDFTSDNGVFSKSEIDYGSQFLVETILKNVNKVDLNILDVGCGYGYMGITLAKVLSSHVDMVDVNNRAIHLANINIKNNKVDSYAFLSDAYTSITKNYDLIVSNPPIRAGKEVVYKILLGASKHLENDAELWFVMRKNHGAKSAINDLGATYDLQIVAKSKGFYVIKAKKH